MSYLTTKSLLITPISAVYVGNSWFRSNLIFRYFDEDASDKDDSCDDASDDDDSCDDDSDEDDDKGVK